jgi:trimeric autotransporter adhesin
MFAGVYRRRPTIHRYVRRRTRPWIGTAAAGGGTAHVLEFNDNLSLSDAVAKDVGKAIADSVTPSEVIVKAVGKNAADTVTVSDASSKTVGKGVSDTATPADAVSKAVVKTTSDTAAPSDAVSKAVVKTTTESVPLADATSKAVTKMPADTVYPMDRDIADWNLGFENVPSPNTAPTSTANRWIDGTAAGSTATMPPFGWAIPGSGLGGTGANAQFDTSIFRTGGASMRLSNPNVGSGISVATFRTNPPTATTVPLEAFPILPSTQYIITGYIRTNNVPSNGAYIDFRQFGEAGGAALATTSTNKLSGTDTSWRQVTITVTTNASARFGSIMLRNFVTGNICDAWFDDITVEMVGPLVKAVGKNVSDTVTVSDAVSKAIAKMVADSVSLSDATSKAVSKTIGDTVALADNAITSLGINIVISDSVVVTDAAAKTIGKAIADSVVTEDAVAKFIHKVIADSVSLTDNVTVIHTTPLPRTEPIGLQSDPAMIALREADRGITLQTAPRRTAN